MTIGDMFKALENKRLKAEIERLNGLLTPELLDVQKATEKLEALKEKTKEVEQQKRSYVFQIDELKKEINKKNKEIKDMRNELIELDEEVLCQSFGLYRPQYEFVNSERYKKELDHIRQRQKEYIKSDSAVLGSNDWSVNGNKTQGRKMVNDTKKLLLRAFNEECDELVSKVKYNNYDVSKKRINASCDSISKLGKVMNISISSGYKQLKIDELTLAFEYAQKKQQEKEEQRELKEQMREEAKLLKEIEEQRKKLLKEQTHYENALQKIKTQLSADPHNADLLAKLQELEKQAAEIEKAIKDVDYREANKRAGYVYIISNIGAFGNDVYKIGMTRRLNPMDRVDELGDASVPFKFDVHAMIFTDDAPSLETALHRAFEDRKLNMVNHRREFFNVTLDEIKDVVKKNYDKTVEFVDVPDAEQYRVSMKMRHKDVE